jgi:hypothetical protein
LKGDNEQRKKGEGERERENSSHNKYQSNDECHKRCILKKTTYEKLLIGWTLLCAVKHFEANTDSVEAKVGLLLLVLLALVVLVVFVKTSCV